MDNIVVIGVAYCCMVNLSSKLTLIERIEKRQSKDPYLLKVKEEITLRIGLDLFLSSDGVFCFEGRPYMPNIHALACFPTS